MNSLLQAIHRANPHHFSDFFSTSQTGWAIMITVYSCFVLGFYVVQTLPFFILFKKANIDKAWLAFVPVVQLFPYFWALKKSTWNILWFIIPVAGFIAAETMNNSLGWEIFGATILLVIVLCIIWQVLFFEAFGMSPLWLLFLVSYVFPLINLIGAIGILAITYNMAFNSRYRYLQ